MNVKLPRSIAFILFAMCLPVAIGQTYTVAGIVFNHPGPYSHDQLQAAAGMHPGTVFTAKDLGDAAQRLIDTGFFTNVGATLASGRYEAITVLFDIEPIDRAQMLHVGFENFVWLSHAEIDAALHAKSPLFAGYLPENSPLADTFNDALTDALAARGITARVSHDTVEPTLLRPERSINFRVDSPTIYVANVKLAGVSPDLVPLIQTSVDAAAKSPYTEGLAGQTTEDRILAPLLDTGYIQASLSGVTLAPSLGVNGASVVLTAALTPGDIYNVSSITFAGSPLLPAESFASTAKLHPGDIASRIHLLETLAPLDAAYRRLGYMDVIIGTSPKLDPAAHTVAYNITVTPGEQYRIHQVTADNLDPAAKAAFDSGWQMKTGELFNPDYIAGFLKTNTALRALAGYTATWKAYADPNNHTVDLVLTFLRGGQLVTPVTVHP